MSIDVNPRFRLESNLALRLAEVINTPRSLMVYLLVKHGEYGQLANLAIDANHYLASEGRKFALDFQITELLRKSPNLPIQADREGQAWASFREAEESNTLTNARLYGAAHPGWFYDVQRRLREILGPLNHSSLQKIWSLAKFGPGATTGVRGERSVASQKYGCAMHLTLELIAFARSLMGELWSNLQKVKIVVKGSGFFTVPKNALTDRGCAKEPTLNSFLQLGVGSFMKMRLRRFGTDLRDQTWNQYLASKAQELDLATLDLSNASNTMSRAVVDELCTFEWGHLLSLARSSMMKGPDGVWRSLAMHSSMGNGYTFDLETTIFKSVVESVVPQTEWCLTGVYGDDIIVPRRYAHLVISALEYLGFSVNRKKTHLAGVYFESCGAHAFNGRDVRPFHCDGGGDSPIPYSLQLSNALRLWAQRMGHGGDCDKTFQGVWESLSRRVPRNWRHPVPQVLGDSGLLTSIAEANPMPATYFEDYYGWEGYAVRHVTLGQVLKRTTHWGLLLERLARAGAYHGWWCEPPTRTLGLEPLRGLYGRPRTGVTVVQWPSGFAWV